MKKAISLFVVITLSLVVHAQAPSMIKYQGVARDAAGAPIANGTLNVVQFDIHTGTPTGTIVFTESHAAVATNAFGLFSVNIGSVTAIPANLFGAGTEFLEVSVDFGAGLISMGTSQLLSVPYALFADSARNPGPIGPVGPQGPAGTAGFQFYFADRDADGFGDKFNNYYGPVALTQYVTDSTDCNDMVAAIFPGAIEICDNIDNDCDGQIDEGLVYVTYFLDSDGDGFGAPSSSTSTCSGAPLGYVASGTDCNDTCSACNPSATEICDGLDNDCDSNIDEGFPMITYYLDIDLDGFGSITSGPTVTTCGPPPFGYNMLGGDCQDGNPSVNPGQVEICGNFIDDNCNGQTDEPGCL